MITIATMAMIVDVERVDGTQARLKQVIAVFFVDALNVERVDGTQARLKRQVPPLGECRFHVERVDGTQARLKPNWSGNLNTSPNGWKGWMGLRRD